MRVTNKCSTGPNIIQSISKADIKDSFRKVHKAQWFYFSMPENMYYVLGKNDDRIEVKPTFIDTNVIYVQEEIQNKSNL